MPASPQKGPQGNLLSRSFGKPAGDGWNSPKADAISGGSSGLHAFAMVPRAHVRSSLHAFDMASRAAFGPNSPALTGGGSIGYNRYNRDV
jgi:hypothetical protein